MGWRNGGTDVQVEQVEQAELVGPAAGCPDLSRHYVTEVDRSHVNLGLWQDTLNQHYREGYRLVRTIERGGQFIAVYEHNFH